MPGEFSKQFHKQTNFDYPVGSLPSNPQYWPKEWKEIYHKEYRRFPKVKLSENILGIGELKSAFEKRRVEREYDTKKYLSLEELSTLLYYSAGVKSQSKNWNEIRRHYPSGGARYPLEIYLGIQRVDGITPGIYHFNVKDNVLETLTTNPKYLEQLKDGLYYPWSKDAAIIYFISAVWERNFMKYKDRGYRIVLMEAGHLAQNLSLTSASLGIKCCNSVGFHNEYINEVLDINNEDEDVFYMALLSR